jgi:peptidoglycan/LPS O-acetylase OafA/YrhL
MNTSDTMPGRRPDIQGLRALAILLVVIFHADLPLSGGFAGVDVFFVISGFVITRLLMTELEASQRIDFWQFYQRRIHRLLPALAVTSTVVALVAIFINPIGTQQTTANTGIAASLFSANGYLYRAAPGYFSPGSEFNPMLHTWSLAVEEQFYFLFPLLISLAWVGFGGRFSSALRRSLVVISILILFAVSFTLSYSMSFGNSVIGHLSAPMQFAFYAPVTRAWEFALGALLVFGSAWQSQLSRSVLMTMSVAGLLILGGSALFIDGSMRFPGLVALAPVAGIAMLIVGGNTGNHWVNRLLSTRPLVWIGDRSYGWYLWHWPFVVFGKAIFPDSPLAVILASVLSLAPAWVSYRFIEAPFRSWHQASRSATLKLASWCIGVPILAFGLLILANKWIVSSKSTIEIGEALQLHADTVRGCEGIKPLLADKEGKCRWNVLNAKGLVLLLGDSNAGHITEPVVKSANAVGFDAIVATIPACPFIDQLSYSNGVANEKCHIFVQDSIRSLASLRPSLIILSTASDGYIEAASTTLRANPEAPLAKTPADKAESWSQGLDSVLKRMNRIAPVIVVHPVPRFHTWALTSCAAYKVWLSPMSCAGTTSRQEVDVWRQRTVEAEQKAVAMNPATTALDLTDALCPGAICSVNQAGVWMFRDGAHLSVPGALQLTDKFEQAIRQAARLEHIH